MFENEVTKGNIRDIKRFALIEIWIAIYNTQRHFNVKNVFIHHQNVDSNVILTLK
jgi:hypothetical protein